MPYDVTYMWDLKYDTKELQNRNRLRDIENRLIMPRGWGVGEGWTGSWGLAAANWYI